MRTISSEFSRALQGNATLLCRGTLTFADGTQRQLTGDDVVTMSCEQATSSDQAFDIGGCVVGKLSITLNNHDGRYDRADFTGATIMAYVGKALSSGTEWVRMGLYHVVQPDSYGGTIALECHDNLSLLSQVKYSEVNTTYPCLPSQALEDICQKCGVILDWGSDRLNDTVRIQRRPDDSNISCLQAAAYLAQLMGLWLRCDGYGHVLAAWYDTDSFDDKMAWSDVSQAWGSDEASQSLWSDTRALITTGSKLRRGTVRVTQVYTSTVRTDDVVITGVSVTERNEVVEDESGNLTNGRDGETSVAGKDGYLISIDQNPFIEYGRSREVAAAIYSRVGGMRFRPFELTAPSDPSIEAGDSIVYLDRKQQSHVSYVTSVTLAVDNAMTVRCSAKSAARNSATGASAATQAIVELRNERKRDVTARQLALADLAEKVAQSSGVYHTEVAQDDGSAIHYLHDKPTLEESGIIWKMTADAVAVSTDGGQTYVTGITATGDAILKRVYAIGIDAEHITTGRLSSHDGQNYFDLDTGEARFSAGTTVGGHSVATQVDVLYAIGDSADEAPTEGWQTTAPKWEDGRYVWTKTRTYHGQDYVDTDPACITGARGASGESVTISSIQYAQGSSGTDVPYTGWQDSVPDVPQGSYLWCRVTYTDGSMTHTCSRIGQDGKSVAIQSATKEGGLTTVVLTDGTTTSTLSIADGTDGENGQPGAPGEDGKPSYVHIAWADAIAGGDPTFGDSGVAWDEYPGTWEDGGGDVLGFSTTDSAGKLYMGVRTDSEEADPTDPSLYTWALVKGADGRDGTDGRPGADGQDGKDADQITALTEQYYLSTSDKEPTGGSWSDDQPLWESGQYMWTRTRVDWKRGVDGLEYSTYTTPALAKALNGMGESIAAMSDDMSFPIMREVVKATDATVERETNANSQEYGKITTDTLYPLIDAKKRTSFESAWKSLDKASRDLRSCISDIYTYVGTPSDRVLAQMRTDYNARVADYRDAVASYRLALDDVQRTLTVNASVDSLDQETVFNKLTNNGTTQGIYLENGLVYINGSYIKSGTIDAGLVKAGTLKARNGGSYWNLDTGEAVFALGSGTTVDGYATSDQLGSVATTANSASANASSALSTANGAATAAASAAQDAETLYYLSTSETAPSKPTSRVTRSGDANGAWSLAKPSVSGNYKYLFYCTQYHKSGGYSWSDVHRDYENNRVAGDASSAKAVTDHITIGTNGVTITGSNGQQVFSTTYGSDGTRSLNNIYGLQSSRAGLAVKDWGVYYGNQNFDTQVGDGNVQFWLTEGKQGSKYPASPATGPGIYLGVPGCYMRLNSTDGFKVSVGNSYIELHPNSDFIVNSNGRYLKLNGTGDTGSYGVLFQVVAGGNQLLMNSGGFDFEVGSRRSSFTSNGWS